MAMLVIAIPSADAASGDVYGYAENGYGSVEYFHTEKVLVIDPDIAISESIDCFVVQDSQVVSQTLSFLPSGKFGVQAELVKDKQVGVTLQLSSTMTQIASWSFTPYQPLTLTVTAGTGGSVSPTSVTHIQSGTSISASSNVMTIGSGSDAVTVTATPSEGYVFGAWSGIPSTGKITGDLTASASFTSNPGPTPPGPTPPGPTPTMYTVSFMTTLGGTISPTSLSVDNGSVITVNGNVINFTSGTVVKSATATPREGYVFVSWSRTSGTVSGDLTITATFAKMTPVEPIHKEVANGSVTIPAEVVSALDIKDASKLVLTIDMVTPSLPNIPSDAACFSISLKYDGKSLTTFPSAIDVVLKYQLPSGADASKLKVYYVSDDGKKVENMNASYDAAAGGMKYQTTHLSVFAITQQNIDPVPPSLTSISVKTAPTKVSYTAGDRFDPTGLVLSLKYDDSSSKDLAYKGNESKFSFSPDLKTALKVTDKTMTITYEGKTTTQSITVSESPSGGDDNSMMIIIIVIIILLLIVAIAFFVMKMRIKP